MIKQKKKTVLEIRSTILDIENYNKEWKYSDVVERLVNRLNKFSRELNLIEFRLEEFHYSSTGKTINSTGYESLLRHTSLLKETLTNDDVIIDNTTSSNNSDNDKVFIVHGRDRQALLEMEGIIYRSGLKPIVLDRAVNSGQTLIEKFEKQSDVKYVIVLLTPDDIGALNEDKELNALSFQFRARQNVIFELGYFFGKLGRERVCCVQSSNVELPSDIKGIVYLSYTSSVEEIEHKIINEIKSITI